MMCEDGVRLHFYDTMSVIQKRVLFSVKPLMEENNTDLFLQVVSFIIVL